VQEAINNIKRHAAARNVWIDLSTTPDSFTVQVRDDGRGFDVAAVRKDYATRGSFGMLNMQERARLIEGQLRVRSSRVAPHQGTTVLLTVPLVSRKKGGTRPLQRITEDE
jgi:signal transduction histidine kinase